MCVSKRIYFIELTTLDLKIGGLVDLHESGSAVTNDFKNDFCRVLTYG